MPATYDLCCWDEQFDAIEEGRKTFEYRLDRGFEKDDVLVLQRFDPQTLTYTGRKLAVRVLSTLKSGFGLPAGYCVMSIQVIA
ncbi:DUF3850 domain-containing protein [Burkholderia gladioli]|uniref:DUF3850 domain-containing protein n=1 Tax=Burkholderia gladioli TaxID=28095 RepID=UPI000D00D135|nr:DUF3850 domain-containing protein [Burkholderia gladioli]PRG56866.1 hypothetical protein C6V06_04255 [Burkholderia gladioli]